MRPLGTAVLDSGVVDRAVHRRDDPESLAAGWASARVLLVDDRCRVAAREGRLLLCPVAQLGFVAGAEGAVSSGMVFLGECSALLAGSSGFDVWAALVDSVPTTAGSDTALGSSDAAGSATAGSAAGIDAVGERIGCDAWLGVRELVGYGQSDTTELGLAVMAIAVINWHRRSRFSAVDGSPTRPILAGWARESARGEIEFPRTDPSMICLVHDGVAGDDGQILLARNAGWPQGQMSVLAGFVEAGESVEACIAREIKEEVGLTVRNIAYLGSQSWPFPRSLMLAYSAIANPHSPLQFSDGEIVAAKWMRRAEVRKYLNTPPESGVALSGAGSIARAMITAWAEDDSPQ